MTPVYSKNANMGKMLVKLVCRCQPYIFLLLVVIVFVVLTLYLYLDGENTGNGYYSGPFSVFSREFSAADADLKNQHLDQQQQEEQVLLTDGWIEERYTPPGSKHPAVLPLRYMSTWLHEGSVGPPPAEVWDLTDPNQIKDRLVFATAASDDHFKECLSAVSTVQQHFPNNKLLFFDFGLSRSNVKRVKRLCGVEYRKSNFSGLPNYVRNLRQYRWKPIVIQRLLDEFGAVLWMDSSVRIIHPEFFNTSLTQAVRTGVVMFSRTRTSIFSVTNPLMFDYIPTDLRAARSMNMFQAGAVMYLNTTEVRRSFFRWYVLCALDANCMAPAGSRLACHFSGNKSQDYAGCHRFDQSCINILLLNHFNLTQPYTFNKRFLVVERIKNHRGFKEKYPQKNVRFCP